MQKFPYEATYRLKLNNNTTKLVLPVKGVNANAIIGWKAYQVTNASNTIPLHRYAKRSLLEIHHKLRTAY